MTLLGNSGEAMLRNPDHPTHRTAGRDDMWAVLIVHVRAAAGAVYWYVNRQVGGLRDRVRAQVQAGTRRRQAEEMIADSTK